MPHLRLLEKCKGLGMDGKLLEWIRVWMEGRKQRVVLNEEASEWSEVLSFRRLGGERWWSLGGW